MTSITMERYGGFPFKGLFFILLIGLVILAIVRAFGNITISFALFAHQLDDFVASLFRGFTVCIDYMLG